MRYYPASLKCGPTVDEFEEGLTILGLVGSSRSPYEKRRARHRAQMPVQMHRHPYHLGRGPPSSSQGTK